MVDTLPPDAIVLMPLSPLVSTDTRKADSLSPLEMNTVLISTFFRPTQLHNPTDFLRQR